MAKTGVWYGYHYRTSSRFGSYVEIIVTGDSVTILGRRVSRDARDAWAVLQAILMALTGLSLIGLLVTGNRRHLRRAGGFALLEYLVAAFGALFVWWPADRGPRGFVSKLPAVGGTAGIDAARRSWTATSFRRADVRDAEVTRWYSRGKLIWISWPWQALMNIGEDKRNTVVFEVPDDEREGETLTYAIQLETAEEAEELVAALRGE